MELTFLDWAVMLVYFVFVLGIGFALKRYMKTSTDFFLSGRSIPAWITGLAFMSANLGAQEVIGMGASGAKYGIATSHFYWIGAIPAMAFIGVFMMPFYYGSRARSVPEYLKLRFDEKTRGFNAISFAVMTVLSSGISLYAMGLLLQTLLGWDFSLSILMSALIVLVYVFLGGLTSAIYNEVLQFFLIVFGFAPLVFLGLKDAGGWSGLAGTFGHGRCQQWLRLGRLERIVEIHDQAIGKPHGHRMVRIGDGVGVRTVVWTYDIYQSYINRGQSDQHYLRMGRMATIFGILISIAAAYVTTRFNNIMDMLQLVFAFVNAPLLATFLLGMFWKRTTGHGAFIGLIAGTIAAAIHHGLTLPVAAHTGVKGGWFGAMHIYPSELAQAFWTAIFAWTSCFVFTIIVSLATKARNEKELAGLVYSLTDRPKEDRLPWYQRPAALALVILLAAIILNIIFW